MSPRTPSFAARVVAWQRRHGRHDLPWQGTRDAYRIWVAEIMLQQTQVAAVLGYYARFVQRFPDVAALAAAPVDEVMRLWSGLGYYARARNLHRAAREVVAKHAGQFPRTFEAVVALPGIGRSTAGAIVAFATGEPRAILDGNVKRVLARHFGIEGPADTAAAQATLWELSESLVPRRNVEAYTQGLMDLGATVCARASPACAACPLRRTCVALRDKRVAELPAPRRRRSPPTRAVAMIVAVSRGEVLLEKRPPDGIWGGLWSLPEMPAEADPKAWSHEELGLAVRAVEPLPPFSHAFTHFTLAVAPWLVRVRHGTKRRQGPRLWLPLQEAGAAALPAPVKALLGRLAAQGSA